MSRLGSAAGWIVSAMCVGFMVGYFVGQSGRASERNPAPRAGRERAPAIEATVSPGEGVQAEVIGNEPAARVAQAPNPPTATARVAQAPNPPTASARVAQNPMPATPAASAPAAREPKVQQSPSSNPPPKPAAAAPTPAVSAPASGGAAGASARIKLDTPTLDFGTLYQMEEVKKEVTFRNIGTAPLTVTKVRSTCGCAAATPSKQRLAPGESASAEITFRAGLLRGKITKHVYLQSDDPAQPEADITVTAEVKAEVATEPVGVHIGKLKVGETLERSVLVRAVEVADFSIQGVTTNHPALHVSDPVKLEGEPTRYMLAIRFGPVEAPGRVNARATVHTNLEHSKEVPIPVYGTIAAAEGEGEPAPK